jgi:hypothetical protein
MGIANPQFESWRRETARAQVPARYTVGRSLGRQKPTYRPKGRRFYEGRKRHHVLGSAAARLIALYERAMPATLGFMNSNDKETDSTDHD